VPNILFWLLLGIFLFSWIGQSEITRFLGVSPGKLLVIYLVGTIVAFFGVYLTGPEQLKK